MSNLSIVLTILFFFHQANSLPQGSLAAEANLVKTPQYDLKAISSCSADYTACLSLEERTINAASQAERFMLDNFVSKISIEEEQWIGKHFHEQANYKYVEDERWRKLNRILNKMRPYILRQEINYKIYLIEDKVINAWTVPGGNIYFTTGMYDFAQSDDEIANIIGHEVGHNECKHPHRSLKRSKGTADLGNMIGQFWGISVNPKVTNLFVELSSIPLVSFGQVDELQADRTGFYLANKIGFDPEKGLDFWKRLAKQEKVNFFEKFMRSHPYSSRRYSCGKSYLQRNKR